MSGAAYIFPSVTGGGGGSGGAGAPVHMRANNLTANGTLFLGNDGELTTTEARAAYPAPRAGVAKNFKVHVQENTKSEDTTITLRVAGADVATVTVPAGQTGEFTSSDTASVAQGDLVSVRVVTAGSGQLDGLAVSYLI